MTRRTETPRNAVRVPLSCSEARAGARRATGVACDTRTGGGGAERRQRLPGARGARGCVANCAGAPPLACEVRGGVARPRGARRTSRGSRALTRIGRPHTMVARRALVSLLLFVAVALQARGTSAGRSSRRGVTRAISGWPPPPGGTRGARAVPLWCPQIFRLLLADAPLRASRGARRARTRARCWPGRTSRPPTRPRSPPPLSTPATRPTCHTSAPTPPPGRTPTRQPGRRHRTRSRGARPVAWARRVVLVLAGGRRSAARRCLCRRRSRLATTVATARLTRRSRTRRRSRRCRRGR